MRDVLAKVIAAEKEISSIGSADKSNRDPEPARRAVPQHRTGRNPLATSRTIEEIELAFYMRYILELDYIAEGHKVTRYMRGDNWD